MSATVDAAGHLWINYLENLHSDKNQAQRTRKQLFNVSKKLITDQTEIRGVSKIDRHSHSWQRTSLLSDKGIQLSTAKAFVFSASVLCLGKMYEYPKATDAWREKMEWTTVSPQCRELDRVDGEPMEFECPNFPGFTTLQILAEIQKMMGEMRCEPEQLTGRIIFITMTLSGEATKTQHRSVFCKFHECGTRCNKIPARILVIPRTWIGKEMVRVKCVQAERRMERCR